MTPEERADAVIDGQLVDFIGMKWCDEIKARASEQITAAIVAEREACMRDVCPRCAKGEPIADADECMTMGHFGRADTCHPFVLGGRQSGHIACLAAAIRARGADVRA